MAYTYMDPLGKAPNNQEIAGGAEEGAAIKPASQAENHLRPIVRRRLSLGGVEPALHRLRGKAPGSPMRAIRGPLRFTLSFVGSLCWMQVIVQV